MLFVLLNGEAGVPYNISSEGCNVCLKDFAAACAKFTGRDVVFDLPSETEQKGYSVAMQAILSNTRLLSIGYQPLYSFDEAIERTLNILACKQ